MANDARSSHRSKDDESNSSGKKPVDGKGSSTSCSASMDTLGLRRSTMETPSWKQKCSRTSTTRKSQHNEKRTPTTSVKRKSEINEIHRMLNPLWSYSMHPSLTSSGSEKSEKGSGSSDVRRKKLKSVKSCMKQLTLEDWEINRREKKLEPKPVDVKKKRMDARTYKSLLKQKRRRDTAPDFIELLERADNLSHVDYSHYHRGSFSKLLDGGVAGGEERSEGIGEESREEGIKRACGGKERPHSRLRNFDAEAVGNDGEVEMSCPTQHHIPEEEPLEPSEGDGFYASKNGQRVKENINDDAEKVQVDCSAVDKVQTPELVGSACIRLFDGDTDEGTRDRVASKGKSYVVEMDCKTSTTFASKDICTSNANALSPPSPPSECNIDKIVGTWVACSKRLRGQRVGKKSKVETDEVGKKRNKVVNNSAGPTSPWPRLKESPSGEGGNSGVPANNGSLLLPRSTDSVKHTLYTNHASASTFPSNDSSSLPEVHMDETEEGIRLRNVQKSLHVLLKPDISRLGEILQLSVDVKVMARRFLEYIVDHHHVNREPTTLLQAFQISLCWIAASLLKYKVDKEESLALAKQHLNFGCTEEEVTNVYSKLRRLKKMFLHRVGKDFISKAEDIMKETPDARMFQSVAFSQQNVKVEIEERSENQEFNADPPISQQEQAPKPKIEVKKYSSTLLRYIQSNTRARLYKSKRLDDKFVKKMQERILQKGIRRKELDAKHFAETNEERQNPICGLEELKSLGKAELSCELPSCGSDFGGTSDDRVQDSHETVAPVSGVLVEEQSPNRMQACNMEPSDMPRTAASEAVGYGIPIDTPSAPNRETDAVDSMASHGASMTAFEELSNANASENNVFVNPHSAEQIPDGATSSAQEVPECVPKELVCGADFVDIVNPDVESKREHNQTDDLDVSALDPLAIQNDAAGNSANGGSLSAELHLVNSPLVQPVVTPAQVCASPQNLATHGECFHLSTSTGMHDGDAQASGNQNVLQQVEVLSLNSTETGSTDQNNHEELLIERAEQLQLSPSTDSPVDHNQPDSHETSGVERLPSEGHTASQTVGASQQFEHSAGPSNQAVMQTGANLAPPPPIHSTDVPLCQNQLGFQFSVENDHQPISEVCTSFLSPEAPSQLVENAAGIPNQFLFGTQLGMHPPIDTTHGRFGTHLQLHSAHQMTTRMPTQPLYADPLHNELERLRKETEQAIKVHEDMKLRLKSDCDKEIEEIIAEIRGKYKVKLKDAEAAFLLKKKELDKNHSGVLMNRILAEAFQSMCLGALRMHQVVPSHFMQQLHLPSSQHATRPSPVTGSASVQFVHHSSPVFSSVPAACRPPLIAPIVPSTGNLQIVREIRAPAPHLQYFRPSSSVSLTSIPFLPRGSPISVPQVPSHPPPPLPPPSHPQTGVTGGIPGILFDFENHPGAHPPNVLPPLPDLGSIFGSLDRSQFGEPGSGGGGGIIDNATCSGVATDIVCLSDDD